MRRSRSSSRPARAPAPWALATALAAGTAADLGAAEAVAAGGPGPGAPLRVHEIAIGDVESIHWGRLGADPRLDLFVLAKGTVQVWEQGASGFGALPAAEVELPRGGTPGALEPGLVDFGDLTGDEAEEIVVLNRRGVFVREHAGEATWRRILPVAGIPVPLEVARSPCIRDLTADGKPDLVVPVRNGFEIYLRRGAELEKGVTLDAEHQVVVKAGGPDLLEPLEWSVRMATLKFKDLNGDGRLDIIARRRAVTRSYLQKPEGFSPQPTYEIDAARFREGEGKGATPGRELLGGGGVKVHEVDIDGDGIQDYLIGSGQYLRVYFGSPSGVDLSRPYQLLKLSSDLQGVGSFDVDGDGRLDLIALKFDLPGMPKLIAAYFISMSLDFEVLGYRNEGGRKFARLPTARNAISLRFPPLRDLMENLEALAERFLAAAVRRQRFAAGDVNGDGLPDAVFLDEDQVLRVFHARPGERSMGDVNLGKILFDAKRSEWEFQALLDFVAGANYSAARGTVEGRRPDLEVPLGPGQDRGATPYDPHEVEIGVRDLDADGKGDVVIRWGKGVLKVALSGP